MEIDGNIYTKNNILSELIRNQRRDVETSKKLYLSDLKRIAKFIPNSIFLMNECSCWQGYITNFNKDNKGTYINFYFRHKKKALHRLLYINFIGDLNENEYVKFKCNNKGFCCALNCMYKTQIKKKEIENKKSRTYSFDYTNVSFDIEFF